MSPDTPSQHNPVALSDMDRGNALIALGVITLFGAILRIWGLGTESLWLDEAFSVIFVRHDFIDFCKRITAVNGPPLYYMFLFVSVKLLGSAEWAVRLPSAIFGILAIPLTYSVGARLFSRRTGLVAGLLLSVSVFHHWHSQDARFYALFCLTTVLSMELLLRHLANPRSTKVMVAWAVSLALVMYSHFLGTLVVGIHAAVVLVEFVRRRKNRDNPLSFWSISILLVPFAAFAPWVPFLRKQMDKGVSYGWIEMPTAKTIAKTFVTFSGGKYLGVLMVLITGSALVFLVYRWWRDRKPARDLAGVVLLMIWIAVPLLGLLIASFSFSPLYHDRYMIPVLPAWLLLVAWGLTRVRLLPLQLALLLAIVGFSTIEIIETTRTPEKEMWREAVAKVESESQPGDTVLFNAYSCLQGPWRFYQTRKDLNTVMMPKFKNKVTDANIGEVTAAVQGLDRVWYVRSHSGDTERRIDAVLRERFRLAEDWFGCGVEVQKYVTRPSDATEEVHQ